MSNIISIYKKVFHCHKNTQHNTLPFESKLLPSSGEGIMLSIFMTMEKVLVNAADVNERLETYHAELPFFLSSKQKSPELPA
jgi:hypothetical protein